MRRREGKGGKRRDETAATPTPLFTADGACKIGLTGQQPRVHPKIIERGSYDVKSDMRELFEWPK